VPENPRIEDLRRRVQADPASIVFAALAEEFRRVGRYDEAIETCRTGLQRHPAYLSARVTLGRSLIETGDFESAREELETVLRSAPENLAAIRGLAQINERLGHSAKMDPHLADLMKTMHEESLRAAALAPPPTFAKASAFAEASADKTVGKPPPEPKPAFIPEPSFAPSPAISLAPEPLDLIAPQADAAVGSFDAALLDLSFTPMAGETPRAPGAFDDAGSFPLDEASEASAADPFAAFAPKAAAGPAKDLPFDLATAFARQPSAPARGEPAADLMATFAAPVEPAPVPVDAFVEPAAGLTFEPVVEAIFPPPAVHAEPQWDAEPEPVLQMAAESGPDPDVLATLARLERFLGAIASLRA
jgi:Tetratricopeptide repeat